MPLVRLSPEDELAYLKELYGEEKAVLLDRVTHSFGILQTRSSMLLSLIALCLTISGFSGPKIAESGAFAALAISLGAFGSIVAAVLLVCGPLQLRWVTTWKDDNFDTSILNLLQTRNQRTRRYHKAAVCLVFGLSMFVLGLIAYTFPFIF